MGTIGKGISDAVRGAIGDWLAPGSGALKLLEAEYLKGTGSKSSIDFGSRVRAASQWVRYVRRLNPKSSGYEREYYCKLFPGEKYAAKVGLRVHTNSKD